MGVCRPRAPRRGVRYKCRPALLVLPASRDIDPVTENILRFDNNVPEIDPNSEGDTRIFGDIRIAVDHRPLHLAGTADGAYHAGKLRQQAIVGVLNDAPAVLPYLWVDQLTKVRLEAFVCTLFVRTHQT